MGTSIKFKLTFQHQSSHPDLHTMSKRLVLSDSDDDVDNLETKKRITIAESNDDDDDDDGSCYNVEAFNITRQKFYEIGYDLDKATELTKQLYRHAKITEISVSPTPSHTINDTLHISSTATRSVSFDDDVPPSRA